MQLGTINHFLLDLDRSLLKYPIEQRKRIREKIIDDLAKTEIFRSYCDEDMEDYESEKDFREGIMTETLQEYGVEDDFEINRFGRNKMHEAVITGDIELVKQLLISEPESINTKDNNGNTPLQCAYLDENEELITVFRSHFGIS